MLCLDKTYTTYRNTDGQPYRAGRVEWVCPDGGRDANHDWIVTTFDKKNLYRFDDPKPIEKKEDWRLFRALLIIAIVVVGIFIFAFLASI